MDLYDPNKYHIHHQHHLRLHLLVLGLLLLDSCHKQFLFRQDHHLLVQDWQYTDNDYGKWDVGKVLLIGTDGIWEAENQQGERFGKQRIKDIVREHAGESVDEILEAVVGAVANFRGPTCQADDITLVVIKRREDGITIQNASKDFGFRPASIDD